MSPTNHFTDIDIIYVCKMRKWTIYRHGALGIFGLDSWFFMVPGGFFMVPGWFFLVPGKFYGFSWFQVVFFMGHGSRSVFMVFQDSRSVFHGSSLVFHGNIMVYGSRLVFMFMHGSMSVFHDSRLVFMVVHCSRLAGGAK